MTSRLNGPTMSGELSSVYTRTLMATALCVAGGMLSAASLQAQRPTVPKDWVVDTTAERPSALRRGGMMSSDARAEILGPMGWTGTSVADWLRGYAASDAGTLGVLIPPTGNPVSTAVIAGRPTVVAAYSVTASTGTLYLSYSLPAETAPGSPALVIRSTFRDALTMVRAFRGSVEALQPYVLLPTDRMQHLAVAAAPRNAPTSFRAPITEGDTSSVAAVPAVDTSVENAVRTGVSDAIALLGGDTASATGTRTSPAGASRASAQRSPRGTASAPAATISEANIALVVFYQWGDLQYHPVALFKDGTAFDLDDVAIDALDVARSRTEHPTKWGQWRRVGPQYVLKAGDNGRESSWTLGSGFHPAFPAPTGGTLSGSYKAVSGTTMGEMSTLLTSTLRFHPDGRFTSGSDFAASGSGAVSGVTMAGGSSRSAGGRYTMSKYHIDLLYESGQKTSYFFGFGSSGEPARVSREMIFIGDTAYVLETPSR